MNFLNGTAFLDFLFSAPAAAAVPQRKTAIAQTISEKISNNLAALHIVKTCSVDGANSLTDSERSVLSAYTGWGQLSCLFEPTHPRHEELKSLLTAREYTALAGSILTSYYTPEWLIDSIYRAVARLGVQEGCMLDPATGSGRFLSRLPASMAGMRQFAVELDGLTGNIARLNNPSAKVYVNQTFESVKLPNSGDFSLVIGNPPYCNVNAKDRTFGALSLHNYFMIRGLMELHIGGLMAYVVSSWVMDAKDSDLRLELAARGNLVAACRLPNAVFTSEGANVVTDILIFQAAEYPEENPSWVDTVETQDAHGKPFRINRLFAENPALVAGELSASTNFNVTCDCKVAAGTDLAALVNSVLDQQTQQPVFYRKASKLQASKGVVSQPTGVDDVGVYEFCLGADGSLLRRLPNCVDEDGHEQKVFMSFEPKYNTDKTRIVAMLRVKSILARLIQAEQENAAEGVIKNHRANLNATYDQFVKDFGPFHSSKNRSVLSEDPWYYRLRALEVDYVAPISKAVADKEGIEARAERWSKGEFFTRRIIKPVVEPTSAADLAEAVLISISYRGLVDLEFIAKLVGHTGDEQSLVRQLAEQSLAFREPESNQVIQAAKYLSGFLRPKLRAAELAAEQDPEFEPNVVALKQAMPAPVQAVDIFVPINARWIPTTFHQDFVRYLAADVNLPVTVLLADDDFNLQVGHISTVKNSVEWGTTRRTMTDLLDALFNNRKIEVKDPHPSIPNQYVVNNDETLAAQHKADEIRAAWEMWALDDATRRDIVQERYNELFNGFVAPKYDGSRLPLNGCALDLYSSQRNAVARAIFDKTMLADHCVGAGKTNFMVAFAHELRRINKNERVVLVAPNHLISQHAAAAQFLFPGLNVLVVDKKQMAPATRRTALARLAISDFDLCIIPLSVFGLIPAPIEMQIELINKEMSAMHDAMAALSGKKFSVRDIQKRLKRKEEQLEALTAKQTDDFLDFSSLRITALVVDESQFAKNLAYSSSLTNVAGLGNPEGSQRAFDLYVKSRCVLRAGGRYIEATGTPILNSVVEAHRHLRFMAEEYTEESGLTHFDAFSAVFAQPVTSHELSASGRGYKQRTRVAVFTNLTELQSIYSSFADVVTEDQLPNIIPRLPDGRSAIPPLSGGKIKELVIEPDAIQEEGFKQIVVDFKNTDRHMNNPLALLNRGRMLSLDARLVYPLAPDHDNNKVNTVARDILARYQATMDVRGTQLVFLDRSIPARHRAAAQSEWSTVIAQADAGDEAAIEKLAGIELGELESMLAGTVSLYDCLVEKLIALGIPEREIAVIHDYRSDVRKDWLRAQVNEGLIRVVLGSTELMGSGSNFNKRMVGLIDFDLPLRPGDLIQRHGRILRQGNELWQNDPSFAVDVVVPITRRSLDAWQLGLLHTKQRFITMFRQLDCSVRHYTEQNEVIDFGELSAIVAGDTRILEHVRGTAELRKLEAAKNSWFRGRMMMQDNLRFNANRIASLDARLPAATADASMVASTKRDSPIAVDGLMYGLSQADTLDSVAAATHKNAYTAFAAEYEKHRFNKRAYAALAQYRGMRLVLDRRDSILGGDTFRVQGQGSTYELEAYIKTHSLAGVLNAFVRFTDEMPRMPRHLAELRSKAALEIENIEAEIDKPFAKQGEIDSLIARLRDLEKQLLEDNQSTQEQAQAA